ncbi:RNA 2',3'-cyclic phosphodiesterase [Pseudomarimonas salicorniae]|uniref:RNA 2',3'-cyclic phosphodiesterase n=1 Tax=Pseudomarimonas salicorniae TaxID=2933270 RepID=A0ABT0GJX4_9GAMM|nr:RNA 2',3'-cyclic phosphodiesterase [Lysobacter sp. CAU 1642]MCK7594849.1 RNA 2',3'-cyclic phosphodiesterase [Lysobacter sp. CAU 1642]
MRIRKLPRCFIAAVPDRAGRDALSAVQSRLREAWPERDADPGWTLTDDLHLTLRFLGDLPESALEQALGSLSLPPGEPAPTLAITGIELWPALRPRIAVARFESSGQLAAWVATVEAWAVEYGLAPEHRPFVPHVTLLRSPKPLSPVSGMLLPELDLRLEAVQAMHRSPHSRGPRYLAHAEYRLV